MTIQCPSVSTGASVFTHEPCATKQCTWWDKRCTAVDTIPVGNLIKRRRCALAASCRWMRQAGGGLCPPMTLGEICEHQGGTFNTFDLEAT